MAEERTTPGIKTALTISGSDTTGGAGLQGDLKTWATMGVYGCAVVTAVTAQSTKGVQQVFNLDPTLVEAQIEAVSGDIDCHAIKVGMVGTVETAKIVATMIKRHQLQPLIVDLAFTTKSGSKLVDDSLAPVIAGELFRFAAVVTPNRLDAVTLLKGGGGESCETIAQGVAAAKQIKKKYGCHGVIVTGFTRPGPQADSPPESVDVYWTGEEIIELVGQKRQTSNLHGAGTTFSAAITAGLSLGKPIEEAVDTAKKVVSEAIRQNVNLGQGYYGPVNHLAWLTVKK